jgi:1,4-alpha-glucan branching enzyme
MLKTILILIGCVLLAGCSYFAPRTQATGPEAEEAQVVFTFYRPSAKRVQLAGDWPENNWARGDGAVGEVNIGLMSSEKGDGMWAIKVPLRPGRYRYLFLVDEVSWHTDPGNPEEVEGGPAGRCSQIVVYSRSNQLELR